MKTLLLTTLLIVGLVGCNSKPMPPQEWPNKGPSAFSPNPTPPNPLSAPWMNWVTVEQIKGSLPAHPIHVGFDVDDTVLYSSPGMHYAFTNRDGKKGANRYGANPLRNPQFFNDWSEKWDEFSIPKYSAKLLIEMHLERGDKVFFLTARPYTGKKERLTQLIQHYFKLKEINPVVFNGFIKSKTENIKDLKLNLYYGDSDSDIVDSQAAGVRAIRVLRPINSIDDRLVHYGKWKEEILIESDR